MEEHPNPTKKIRDHLGELRKQALDEIERFKNGLDRDPNMTMEQADRTFMAAARIREYAYLENALQAVDEGRLELSKLYSSVRKSLEGDRPRQFSSSTSPSWNLMEKARGIVSVEWITPSHSTLPEAVRTLAETQTPQIDPRHS